MFLVDSINPELSLGQNCIVPNEKFWEKYKKLYALSD